jgi:hypothetical protein
MGRVVSRSREPDGFALPVRVLVPEKRPAAMTNWLEPIFMVIGEPWEFSAKPDPVIVSAFDSGPVVTAREIDGAAMVTEVEAVLNGAPVLS